MGGEGRGAGAGVWTRGQAATWETGRKPRAETGSAPDTATHARTRARVCTDAHAHTSARTGTARGSGELGGTTRVRKGGPGLGLMQGARSGFQSQRLAQSAALWEASQGDGQLETHATSLVLPSLADQVWNQASSRLGWET